MEKQIVKKPYEKPQFIKINKTEMMPQCSAGQGVTSGGTCEAGSGNPSP